MQLDCSALIMYTYCTRTLWVHTRLLIRDLTCPAPPPLLAHSLALPVALEIVRNRGSYGVVLSKLSAATMPSRNSLSSNRETGIGILLTETIKPIKFNIEHTACKFRTRLESGILRKRSALQFMYDDYGDFPAENSLLAKKFEEANLRESVEILDDIIRKWFDVEDSDEGQSDREIQIRGIPGSHSWWSQ
ncbi:hypothetical protein EVAR_95821_1 [Eumeta japonica]|uniref:Uncharacterized protein n=1 Tax=Eumeta variegata TaxID=151549 RepID=A0A4C1W3U8_EUMVA|nr:hypothetical protein EVAR_95821_1 [Eumeta japonica]